MSKTTASACRHDFAMVANDLAKIIFLKLTTMTKLRPLGNRSITHKLSLEIEIELGEERKR